MKQLRTDLDFTKAYGSMPVSFAHRVQYALEKTEQTRSPRRPVLRTLLIVLALLTFTTAACAAVLSQTADIIGFFFGQEMRDKLLAGDVAVSGKSCRLGDVIYTVEEAVWTDDVLYASGTIRAAEDAGIILVPEGYGVDDPAGYPAHLGLEASIPEDAPTYRQLAQATGAKLVQVWCHILNNISPSNKAIFGDSGSIIMAKPDGSAVFACEFTPISVDMEDLRSGDCVALFRVSQRELTLDGEIIDDTRQSEDWAVMILPAG